MLYGIVAHRMGPDKAAGSRLRPWSRPGIAWSAAGALPLWTVAHLGPHKEFLALSDLHRQRVRRKLIKQSLLSLSLTRKA